MSTVSIADQLKILIELQKLDGEIYRLRRQIQSQPAKSAQLKEEHSKKTEGLKAAEARAKAIELKRNQMELELGQREAQIKKIQGQLFAVKTNKEYSAMQLEIESSKADKSVLEEEILKLMEEVDKAKGQVGVERDQLKVQEGELNVRLSEIDQETQKIKAEADRLQAERAAQAPKVDPQILTRYERVLERKEGSALVPVRGNACSGCNMVLPPQAYNEVMMNTRLIPCENCARILYIEPEASGS